MIAKPYVQLTEKVWGENRKILGDINLKLATPSPQDLFRENVRTLKEALAAMANLPRDDAIFFEQHILRFPSLTESFITASPDYRSRTEDLKCLSTGVYIF